MARSTPVSSASAQPGATSSCPTTTSPTRTTRLHTGTIPRPRPSHDVLAVDLATEAAKEAIAKSGVDPKLIDAVIIATISNGQQTSSMADTAAARVGAATA